jgi:ribosomal protein S18 acetylase RimI-like enzyme
VAAIRRLSRARSPPVVENGVDARRTNAAAGGGNAVPHRPDPVCCWLPPRPKAKDAARGALQLRNDGAVDVVCVTVDCADPAAVAAFWSEALCWPNLRVDPDGSGAVCRSPVGGAYLEFVRVPEGKVAKNRLHLGCTAGDLDRIDDEIARLEALGASVAWEEQFPTEVAEVYRNVVLRDVEGNEFCLGAGRMPSAPTAHDVVVRDAREDDRSTIVELAARLADATPPWRDRTAVEAAVAGSAAALIDDVSHDGAVLVADVDREIVGFVSVSRRRHLAGLVDASIDDLAVARNWERLGVARALLKSAEAWARSQSLERITVETVAGNERAVALYRSAGYRDEDLRLTKVLGK